MKRNIINRKIKKNSIEHILESACVQLTKENFSLRAVLFSLIKENNSEIEDRNIYEWINQNMQKCPKLSEEQELHILRQVDQYKYGKKA